MKQIKTCRPPPALLCLTVLACLHTGGNAHAEVDTAFAVRAIIPGMTESIDIGQLRSFPIGCHTFFIFTAGEGLLGISLLKDDTAGDIIFMLGAVTSSAGTVPLCRIGETKTMIDQIVEVGPRGFAWVYFGVLYSASVPKYSYQLRLSLAP